MSLVHKLQLDALSGNTTVVELLRRAKVIAVKLDLNDAIVWIDRELNGYLDLKFDDLPPYRRLSGSPKAWNPYQGWQPIHFENDEHARLFSRAPIGQALGSIEESTKDAKGGTFSFAYQSAPKSNLMRAIGCDTDVCIHLDHASVWNIVDQVRNLILNWSLELEKAGILGEGMRFSDDEKREAEPISQQFFIQNVGTLGNIDGQARVVISQSAEIEIKVDQIRSFVGQARRALPLLPEATQRDLTPIIEELETESTKDSPSRSRFSALLQSARTIAEGASGNIAAEGILALIRTVLS